MIMESIHSDYSYNPFWFWYQYILLPQWTCFDSARRKSSRVPFWYLNQLILIMESIRFDSRINPFWFQNQYSKNQCSARRGLISILVWLWYSDSGLILVLESFHFDSGIIPFWFWNHSIKIPESIHFDSRIIPFWFQNHSILILEHRH